MVSELRERAGELRNNFNSISRTWKPKKKNQSEMKDTLTETKNIL